MKRLACLLALAAFAAVAPSYGQGGSESADSVQIGSLHRPTPKPGASPGTNAAKGSNGPMEVGLFKDAQGKSAATTFSSTEPVYLVGKNVTAAKGDKIGAVWYDDRSGKGKSKKVYQSSTSVADAGSYNPSFSLAAAKGGTPAGAYHGELVVNGKAVKTLPFTVK